MGRLIIWSLTAIFGYVCIGLTVGVFLLQSAMRRMMESLPRGEGGIVVYQHDTYWTLIPGLRMTLHPHPWAAVMLVVGLGLVVLALIFLLHVPVQDPL